MFKRTAPKRSNMRAVLPVLLLSALVAGVFFDASQAYANPMPRMDIMVKSKDIRLGDVFEGLNKHADFVLAPAPKPGEELVWNAPTLMRIATAFNLPWRPGSTDAVHIRRDATLVDAETIKVFLREYLATRNEIDGDTYNISFSTAVPEIVVPGMDTPNIEVADISIPPTGGPFSAIVKVSAGNGHVETINIRGQAERMVRVPVLKRSIANGTVINDSDITWVTQPALSVGRGVLREASLVVGATPRRSVIAGNYISDNDLQQPLVVSRGEAVTMVFDQGGMYLTTKGKALEDGAMGQTIKIMNLSSSRQLEGKVTANRQVTVQ